ncbi:MAG TPA: glycosyltransferase family 4 protein [Candidatus Melainabacteria bacterium]|nr:glycosyltransferase family 4 protein [Candidatus Melainabacteria bacterium]
MRIAQLAPLAESVPPKGYGGSELVVNLLTEELVKRGHDVTLFATADSETDGRLIECAPEGLRASSIAPTRWHAYNIKALIKLEEMQSQFDIIHNHMGYAALPALSKFRCPVVTTNHNPLYDYCKDIYFAYGKMQFISISDAYKRLNYPDKVNYITTVYNGINLDDFSIDLNVERKHLLFLGRLCADKGTKEAIEIARRLDMPIVLAGKVDRNDEPYFNQFIKPCLKDPNVKFVGEVSTEEKNKLYNSAIATLCPINFEEPFGLVFSESLACGTPVLALRRGAAPEVISDGETGVIGDSIDELVSRFEEISGITQQTCRDRVARLFSKEKMTDSYLKAFELAISNCLAKR